MKIGIAGAGGIGSNVAVHLVRSGVESIKIADFDRIEKSNLNRQFYFYDQIGMYKSEAVKLNLDRIGSSTKIESVNIKIEAENIEELFNDCDIVVEAFDKKEYKKILVELLGAKGKKIVSASGIGGTECHTITSRRVGGNIKIIGDFTSDISQFKTYSHKVSVVASLMAEEVIAMGGLAVEDR